MADDDQERRLKDRLVEEGKAQRLRAMWMGEQDQDRHLRSILQATSHEAFQRDLLDRRDTTSLSTPLREMGFSSLSTAGGDQPRLDPRLYELESAAAWGGLSPDRARLLQDSFSTSSSLPLRGSDEDAYEALLRTLRPAEPSSTFNMSSLSRFDSHRMGDAIFPSGSSSSLRDALLLQNERLSDYRSLLLDRQQQPRVDDEVVLLAAQRDALRRSVLEQEAINDRLELLARHQQDQIESRAFDRPGLSGTTASSAASRLRLDSLSESYGQPSLKSDRGVSGEASVRDDYDIIMPWEALVGDGGLADTNLRGVVSDLHIALMAQMRPCQLNHEDRIGLYKTRAIGFRGMCCKHCGGVTGFGRYFSGSLTSLVNGNICKSITKHLTEECRKCPRGLRESILKLELHDEHNPFHYRRGSRRRFFSKIWEKIQEGTPEGSEEASNADSNEVVTEEDLGIEAPSFRNDIGIPWRMILEDSEVVQPSDRHLVPDTIFAATAQTKPCQVAEGDRVGRCKDHKLGSMGLCCKHCGGKPGAYGRYFPSNLHTFAQVEVCKQVVKHITRKCPACPVEVRQAIMDLQRREQGNSSKRYPSRMIFFRRVWGRFHANQKTEPTDDGATDGGTLSYEDIPWEDLVKDSKLVMKEDKGLIPDSQFVSIAQMDICSLTEEDKIGYNKAREVGFSGLCCRFCRGKPGFGRFFPSTVRNLEKTSARDTMVSHISLFCQSCPDDVRDAVLSLKRIETSRDGSSTMKGLIYGSGKLFFRRIWSRFQGTPAQDESAELDEEDDSKPSPKSSQTNSPALSRSCRGDKDESSPIHSDSSDDSVDGSGREQMMDQRKRKQQQQTASSKRKSKKQKPDANSDDRGGKSVAKEALDQSRAIVTAAA